MEFKIETLTPNTAKFRYYNIRERKAFEELSEAMGYRISEFSPIDRHESWDVIFSDEKNRCLGEIKVRKRFSHETPGGKKGWIFEKTKYDELMNSHIGRLIAHVRLKTVFIVFFFDCVAIWNVADIKESDFAPEWLKCTSVDGREEYKFKDVVFLQLEDAKIIDYKLDYTNLATSSREIFKFLYPNNNINNIEYKQD